MTVYYAVGGGLGHQTRARRVVEALSLDGVEIVTSADLPARLEGDRDGHRRWCEDRFRGGHVLVDAFPAGIQGELSGIEGVHFDYVARLVQWSAYREAVPHDAPRFEATYLTEPLTPSHDEFVRASSARVLPLTLSAPTPAHPKDANVAAPYALVVHSGPAAEVEELITYAGELGSERILVATRCDFSLSSVVERIDTDRPFDYFEGATRIISAAGFNVMLETEQWSEKHHVLPFPRRFDDQFLRAARRRGRMRQPPHLGATG